MRRRRSHGRFSFGGYNDAAAAAVAIDGQFVLAGRWFYEAFPRYFRFGAIAALFKLGNAVAQQRRSFSNKRRFFRNDNFRFRFGFRE